MITNFEIAELLVKLYDKNQWDTFSYVNDGSICWAVTTLNNIDVLCFRGSRTFSDWVRDLLAFTLPFVHGSLGPLHPGFSLGMDEECLRILPHIGKRPLVLAGHSLGAAHASIMNGLLTFGHKDVTVVSRVLFGEPRPGFVNLSKLLVNTKAFNYRNGHDLVTAVPLTLYPLEAYVHSSPLIDVNQPPATGDTWGPFAYHHMELYAQAVDKAQVSVS